MTDPLGADLLGRTAYEAYGAAREWRTFAGDLMAPWAVQSSEIRQAWIAAAEAVAQVVRDNVK